MQVEADGVKCMQTNFGGRGLWFWRYCYFQIWSNFPERVHKNREKNLQFYGVKQSKI